MSAPGSPFIDSPALSIEPFYGVPFEWSIVGSNGATDYTAVDLPAGLSIHAVTGLISGTPTRRGLSEVLVTATNATGKGTLMLTVRVQYPPMSQKETRDIILAVVGIIVGIVLMVAFIYFASRMNQKKIRNNDKQQLLNDQSGSE